MNQPHLDDAETFRLDAVDDFSDDVFLDAVYVKVIDVSIKIMATAAVIFPRKVPAPLEPKTVWLDPPKAAPIFAPLPACSKTIKIKVIQATMCMMVNNVVIFYVLFK